MTVENILILTGLVVWAGLLLLLVVRFVNHARHFYQRTRFLVGRLRAAQSDGAFAQGRKELYCHYLTLIPFVNDGRAQWLYRHLFYKARYAKPREHFDGLNHLMLPSLMTMFLCSLCLCGMSWAWFTATEEGSVSAIQSATFSVSVEQKVGEVSTTLGESEPGIYSIELVSGEAYTFTITAEGTASKGYCVINLGNTAYITPQLQPGQTYTFSVTGQAGLILTIGSHWGEAQGTALENEATISAN